MDIIDEEDKVKEISQIQQQQQPQLQQLISGIQAPKKNKFLLNSQLDFWTQAQGDNAINNWLANNQGAKSSVIKSAQNWISGEWKKLKEQKPPDIEKRKNNFLTNSTALNDPVLLMNQWQKAGTQNSFNNIFQMITAGGLDLQQSFRINNNTGAITTGSTTAIGRAQGLSKKLVKAVFGDLKRQTYAVKQVRSFVKSWNITMSFLRRYGLQNFDHYRDVNMQMRDMNAIPAIKGVNTLYRYATNPKYKDVKNLQELVSVRNASIRTGRRKLYDIFTQRMNKFTVDFDQLFGFKSEVLLPKGASKITGSQSTRTQSQQDID